MASSPVLRRALASLLAGAVATGLGAGVFGDPAAADPRPSLNQVQRQVDALNHQAEQATERYNTARVELVQTNRRLRAVRNRFERQQASFSQMRELVGRLAAATYKGGSIDPGIALLLSDDPTTFLRQAADLEQLSQQQGATLRTMATVRLRLEQDRLAVRQQQAAAEGLEADLAAEKRSIEGKLDHAQRLLGSLEADQLARLDDQRRAAQARALAARDSAPRASRDSHDGAAETAPVASPGDSTAGDSTAGDASPGNPSPGDGSAGNGGSGGGSSGGGGGSGGGGSGGGDRDAGDRDAGDRDAGDRDAGDRDAGGGDGATSGRSASGRAAEAVRAAYAQLGDPYAWGADGPDSFDCSGLTMYAWGAAGVSLPHSSSAQYAAVRRIPVSDLQPGDLVFYYSPISHVALYIGGGRVIDAPYPGRSVHITGLYSMPLVGAGRP